MQEFRGDLGTILRSSGLRSGPSILIGLVLVDEHRGLGRHLSLGKRLPRDGRHGGMLCQSQFVIFVRLMDSF